ncbi:MAG: VOC family protein [Anaerolineae bacterium]|nr:VOC family protein [Anaerolineae bacterium]
MLSDSVVIAMIPCADLDRARQFYEGQLKLTPREDTPGGITYVCKGGTLFLLYPSGFAGAAQTTAMSWVVDDILAEMEELRAQGVAFEEYDMPGLKTVNGVAEFPGSRSAWFKDPDGNILGLTEVD